MKAEVLSMGTMYADINAKRFPCQNGLVPGTEVVGRDYEIVPGGSALIFAQVCAALDLQPAFIGKAGNDVMGDVLSGLVAKIGVIPAFIRSSDVTTNIGMNFLGEDESSIMTVVGSANEALSGDEVASQVDLYIKEIKYLYLGGCFKLKGLMPSYNGIAIKAREKSIKVALDHGRITNVVTEADKETMRNLLPHVDYYFPSRDEFLALWEIETIEEGFKKVKDVSDSLIVVKDAENGAIGFDGKNIVRVPAFPVNVINNVGAGDSFNAGFIKAQSLQMGFEESIRFACATTALKISQTDLPSLEKIASLLHKWACLKFCEETK